MPQPYEAAAAKGSLNSHRFSSSPYFTDPLSHVQFTTNHLLMRYNKFARNGPSKIDIFSTCQSIFHGQHSTPTPVRQMTIVQVYLVRM